MSTPSHFHRSGTIVLLAFVGCRDAAHEAPPEPAPVIVETPGTDPVVAAPTPIVATPIVATPIVATPIVATPTNPVVAPAPKLPAAIVAGPRGVFEIDLNGKEVRALSATPSRSPRWLPGRTKLAFLARKGNTFTDLRLLDLEAGTERSIAQVPDAAPCPRAAYEASGEVVPELALTNESELWITDDGKHACIVLADHEADLRDNERTSAVALADGRLAQSVFGGSSVCEIETQDRPAPCAEAPARDAPEIESPYVDADDPLAVESRSPDGRWLLVLVRSELNDIVHSEYVLFDAERKLSFPLPRRGATSWPKPIDIVKLAAKHPGWIPRLDDVSGSEAITWIGEHHLVIGRTLFVAGEAIVGLAGDVAL